LIATTDEVPINVVGVVDVRVDDRDSDLLSDSDVLFSFVEHIAGIVAFVRAHRLTS
jgi:hypothetical protein